MTQLMHAVAAQALAMDTSKVEQTSKVVLTLLERLGSNDVETVIALFAALEYYCSKHPIALACARQSIQLTTQSLGQMDRVIEEVHGHA